MGDAVVQPLPSVNDFHPVEEGGPIARAGFDYQDEVAVGFVLDALTDPSCLAVHCETHDDVVLVVDAVPDGECVAEYVQVKAGVPDKLWSVADLCKRTKGVEGTSIFEKSLSRDACREVSRFRMVTLRPVTAELRVLTYPIGSPSRASDSAAMTALQTALSDKLPGLLSPKGNGIAYWIENCQWHDGDNLAAVRKANQLKVLGLSITDGKPILPEFADVLLEELRIMVKRAGVAMWEPDPAEKIIGRQRVRDWWDRRLQELVDGISQISGGKLRQKLAAASLEELTDLASELRRDYAAVLRVSTYMADDDRSRLQRRVKAEMLSLRSGLMAGTLDLDGPAFHALCLERLDEVRAEFADGDVDLPAFLQGCMYDITDRCLLRFARPV